jgi:hypothetical protein
VEAEHGLPPPPACCCRAGRLRGRRLGPRLRGTGEPPLPVHAAAASTAAASAGIVVAVAIGAGGGRYYARLEEA